MSDVDAAQLSERLDEILAHLRELSARLTELEDRVTRMAAAAQQ